MTELRAAVLPGLLLLAFGCDQGNDSGTDAGSDPAPDTVEDIAQEDDPALEPIDDPEPEIPFDPAAPFALLELFTSEG